MVRTYMFPNPSSTSVSSVGLIVAAIGYTGGAQLPLGASDGPDIPIPVCDPSPAHQDEWTQQDLQPGEIRILMAVHAFVEEETEVIRAQANNALEGHWGELTDLFDTVHRQDEYIKVLTDLLQRYKIDVPVM